MALAAALLPLGCRPITTSTPAANSTRSEADEEMRVAEQAAVEAARAKRDEYAREMQKKFDQLEAKYEALEKRAAEAKGDARKDLDDKVKVAKARRDATAKKLDELKEASHDRWEKIKDSVENAFDDLKKVIE
jgi:DNA anti-recombination protein RmuC